MLRKVFLYSFRWLKLPLEMGGGQILNSIYARGEGYVNSVHVHRRGGGLKFSNFGVYVLNK